MGNIHYALNYRLEHQEMALSNRDRIGRALDLLSAGLKPFVVREMETTYGPRWRYEAVGALQDHHITEDGRICAWMCRLSCS